MDARKRKYRKSTHAILKEEKEALVVEVEALTARLDELKTKVFGNQDNEEEHGRRCKSEMVENRLLRRALLKQQDQFTAVHALVNEYSLTDIEVGSTLHRFIHLDKDGESRQVALAAMKDDIISRGVQLLQQRKPQVHHPWRPMRNDHCFEASTGDYYASSFAVMPFKHFKTVQQAFDALVVYFTNLEISISEQFGSVTIREDSDNVNAEFAQNRLVTTTQSGHQTESNTIFFSKFVGKGGDADQQREQEIIICGYVDEDDRYPFHEKARVRRDLSSVLEVSSYVRPTPMRSDVGEIDAMEGTVVVLTRWVHTRLHYPQFTILPEHWDGMCQNTERWMQFLQPSVSETLL